MIITILTIIDLLITALVVLTGVGLALFYAVGHLVPVIVRFLMKL